MVVKRVNKSGQVVLDGGRDLRRSQEYSPGFGRAYAELYLHYRGRVQSEAKAIRQRLDGRLSTWRRVIPSAHALRASCPWFACARLGEVLEFLG